MILGSSSFVGYEWNIRVRDIARLFLVAKIKANRFNASVTYNPDDGEPSGMWTPSGCCSPELRAA